MKVKVIIVDDSSFIRNITIDFLEKNEKISVEGYCDDGIEIIHCLKRYTVDVVIMDGEMKMLNGDQATKIIRTHFPNIKVIAYINSSQMNIWKSKMLESGAIAVFNKTTQVDDMIKYISIDLHKDLFINKII